MTKEECLKLKRGNKVICCFSGYDLETHSAVKNAMTRNCTVRHIVQGKNGQVLAIVAIDGNILGNVFSSSTKSNT